MTFIKPKYLKKVFFLIPLAAILLSCNETPESNNVPVNAGNNQSEVVEENVMGFDSVRAAKIGADDYGMKTYVMAFLKRGPNRELDKEKATELQAAHLANIGRLAEAGKLVLAGPFFGDGDLRGIYVFDVETIEEAEALTKTDPAIQAGSLVMELIPWYGSAALMELNEIHEKIAKKLI
jgi:uncharacterized protein YciI